MKNQVLAREEAKISVLIPMYNVENYIGKCLKSVVNQSYKNLEIIVVDDGSKDGSAEIVKQYMQKDNRIKLYSKQNEKSLSKTRNYLLKLVKTPYFIFVDSDDCVSKNYVKTLYNNLILNNADCSACSFKLLGFPALKIFNKTAIISDDDIISNMILSNKIRCVVWNKIFITEKVKDIVFDNTASYGEDFVFCYKYLSNCKKVVYTSKRLYKYRFRKGSTIHQKFNQNYVLFLNELFRLLENEKSEKNCNALKAWICYTSKFYLRLLKNNREEYRDYIEKLNSNIKQYRVYLKNNKYLCRLYKIGYKFI